MPPALQAFDDVVIDREARRLLRGGVERPLEPKAFGVLALLAGTPGRAFTRDEILDAVWGHRHVTPGVLNRVMTLLRHALGEEANAPRYLHTLHGVGYRFDLPVDAPQDIGANNPQAPRDDAPPHAPAMRRAGDALQAPPLRRADDRAEASSRIPMPAPVRRFRGAGIVAAACLALGTLSFAGWQWRRAASGPPAIRTAGTAMPTLVVVPFKPIGDAPQEREIAAGLSEELIGELSRIDGLRVIARESTALAAAPGADVAMLGGRLDATHALEGSLREVDEQLRIHVRLADARDGRTLWTQDYDRDVTDVLLLERDIAQAVASTLTLRLGLAFGPPGKGGDADYYRRYLVARALLAEPILNTEDDALARNETQFRALVAERPHDPRAQAGLAVALSKHAFRNPERATALRAEASAHAGIARQLDSALPEPYHVEAAAACRANDWVRCLALFRKALALAPSSSPPRLDYAMALAALGYLDRAEAELRYGLERDPLNRLLRFGYGRILDTRGRHDEANAQFAPTSASIYARWYNAVWRGDLAAARRHADAIGADPARSGAYDRMLRRSYQLSTEALQDPARWPAARAAMHDTERRSGLMNFIAVLDPKRDVPALVDGLDVVRQRSYSSWDLLLWTHDLAYLRRGPAFQAYLRRNGILDYWRMHGYPVQCRPLGNTVDCD